MITLLAAIVGFTTGRTIAGVAVQIKERAIMAKRYKNERI